MLLAGIRSRLQRGLSVFAKPAPGRPQPGPPQAAPVAAEMVADNTMARVRELEAAGDLVGAERLLRDWAAHATPPTRALLALATFLERCLRFDEAESVIRQVIALAPRLTEARQTQVRILTHLVRHDDAVASMQALLDIDPENARTWLEYGQLTRYLYIVPAGTADRAFTRAAELASDDELDVLAMAGRYFLDEFKFADAVRCFDALHARGRTMFNDPGLCREYARCLHACGRADEVAAIVAFGRERCATMAALSQGEDWEQIKREEALLLLDVGDADLAEPVLRLLKDRAEATGVNHARPEYLPRTPERLRQLERLIAAQDVIVFLQGPSFNDFTPHLGDIRDADFRAVTLGSFAPVQAELRRGLGRGIDLLMITHPSSVQSWYPELLEFLTRPQPGMLLTTAYALSSLGALGTDAGAFVAQHDNRLLYCHPTDGPPIPSRPLHFNPENSLSLLLPMLALGRPRRIFVVGADGGGHPDYQRPYFFYNDIDTPDDDEAVLQRPNMLEFKGQPARLHEANRRFSLAARNCDRLVLHAFRFLESVFDVPSPPVYIVCPHSTHQAFPRIDGDMAVRMLRT